MKPWLPGSVNCSVPSFSARKAEGLSAWRSRASTSACGDRAPCPGVDPGLGRSQRVLDSDGCSPGSDITFIGTPEDLVGRMGLRLETEPERFVEVAEQGAIAHQMQRKRQERPFRTDHQAPEPCDQTSGEQAVHDVVKDVERPRHRPVPQSPHHVAGYVADKVD